MTAKVVNIRDEPYDVLVARPSDWGNPFVVGVHVRHRYEAIERYEAWLLKQPLLLARLPELRGKRLGCFCAPLRCHADVLLRLANPLDPVDDDELYKAFLDEDQ